MAPFLFLITWWVALLTPKPQRPAYKNMWYAMLSIALIISFIKTIDAYDEHWHPQTSIKNESKVYVGPDKNYGVSTTLMPGEIVRIYQKETSWCKIKKQDLVGWIPIEHVT